MHLKIRSAQNAPCPWKTTGMEKKKHAHCKYCILFDRALEVLVSDSDFKCLTILQKGSQQRLSFSFKDFV